MEILETEFLHKKHEFLLLVKADVAHGWRRLKSNYGFFAKMHLDYRGDRRLLVQVAVDAWPKEMGKFTETFPIEIKTSGRGEMFLYSVSKGRLRVGVPMKIVESNSLKHSKKQGIFEGPVEIGRDSNVRYWLRLLVYLDPPPGRKPGDTWENDTLPFYTGGLPGLGKKR